MKVKTMEVLRRAIEEGVTHGLMRCEKHEYVELKNESMAIDEVQSRIIDAIDEFFIIDNPEQSWYNRVRGMEPHHD